MTYFNELFLGDRVIRLHLPSSMLVAGKRYVSMNSEQTGYCIEIQKLKIIITCHNTWKLFAGLPSIYRFVGKLGDSHQTGDKVSIAGIVTIQPLAKAFLSIWFGILSLFLIIALVQAILLLSKIMFSLNAAYIDDLTEVGFMLGSGILMAVVGVAVLAIVKLIFKGERQRLIEFCANISHHLQGKRMI